MDPHKTLRNIKIIKWNLNPETKLKSMAKINGYRVRGNMAKGILEIKKREKRIK